MGGGGNKGCHVTAISSCHSTDSQNGSVSQQLGEGPRIYDRCTTPQKELGDFEVWCSLGASKLELRIKCYFYDPCGTGCGKNLLAETFLVAHPETLYQGGEEATRVAMWQPFRAATAQTAKMARFSQQLGEGPRIYDRCTTPQKELGDFEVWCSLGASKCLLISFLMSRHR